MHFEENQFYHVFNRGINRQKIFLQDRNYLFFVQKLEKELLSYSDIVAFCLMPNHYHLLLRVNIGQTAQSGLTNKAMHPLSRKIGTLQSSYTQAINKQEDRVGSLFQQKAKGIKLINDDSAFICFHYIHQKPVRANLCTRMEDWPYSSYSIYIQDQTNSIINKNLAYDCLGIPESSKLFREQSLKVIRDDQIDKFE